MVNASIRVWGKEVMVPGPAVACAQVPSLVHLSRLIIFFFFSERDLSISDVPWHMNRCVLKKGSEGLKFLNPGVNNTKQASLLEDILDFCIFKCVVWIFRRDIEYTNYLTIKSFFHKHLTHLLCQPFNKYLLSTYCMLLSTVNTTAIKPVKICIFVSFMELAL